MKIGVYDSGLGGLFILKSLKESLPDYDYLFLGDTLHVPYGDKSPEILYQLAQKSVDYLFQNDCQIIITASNTISALALKKLQREYLPQHYPDRRILGVIVPTLEEAIEQNPSRMGLIATNATIESNVYKKELLKKTPDLKLFQQATPLLVPLVENNDIETLKIVIKKYLEPLAQNNIDSLLLGCTHYIALKPLIKEFYGDKSPNIISQDDFLPKKLAQYLKKHTHFEKKIGKNSSLDFRITNPSPLYRRRIKSIYGEQLSFQVVSYF